MNLLSDIITYVRRLVKSPSNAQLSDNLIIDYINRFWLMDMSARIQLFDLKTMYRFETIAGLDSYNMPTYNIQTEPGSQTIAPYPVYQGFESPCFANGIQIPFYVENNAFYNLWPNYIQPLTPVATGDGVTTTFQINLPFFPAIPGHLDMTGNIALNNIPLQDPYFTTSFTPAQLTSSGTINVPTTSFYPAVFITYTNGNGSNTTIIDSGVFLSSGTTGDLYGLLIQQGNAPYGNSPLGGNSYSTTNCTVNYNTGVANVTFPSAPPANTPIQAQCYFYEPGIPRAVMFYNNTITLRPPPNTQYLIELTGYLTPCAFLNTLAAIPFAYTAEYIARGAARKLLSDTGDVEQFMFYEPLFKEQELLVWKRSQRQFTSTRTGTIFSETQWQTNANSQGMGTQ